MTAALRHLALQHALALWDGRQVGAPHPRPALGEVAFPVLARIAEYAEDGRWKRTSLSAFLPTAFSRGECPAAGLGDLLAQELDAGGCLLLLDGLDEIVAADDRRGVVNQIEAFVRQHARGGRRGPNRFIITSRIAGYRSAPLGGPGGEPVAHYVVQEMGREEIQRFLERWCPAVEDAETPEKSFVARKATAQREIDAIMQAVDKNPGVRQLAANPLLLTILALIQRTGAQLPRRRIELYRLAADTLARTWRTAMGVPESALVEERYLTRMLGRMAYWMHVHKPTGLATEREVYDVLGAEWAKVKRRQWDPDDPDLLLEGDVRRLGDASPSYPKPSIFGPILAHNCGRPVNCAQFSRIRRTPSSDTMPEPTR